jgi:GH24 family phage-related lysozyme (muramidase)
MDPRIDPARLPVLPWLAARTLLQFLQRHEGLRLKVYKDSAGHDTIGYGHKLDPEAEGGWPLTIGEHQATELLLVDATAACYAAQRVFDRHYGNWSALPPIIKAALTEMAFNLGSAGLSRFTHFLHAAASGNMAALRAHSARHYRSPDGDWVPLTRRNQGFIDTFLQGDPYDARTESRPELEAPERRSAEGVPEEAQEEALEGLHQQPEPALAAPRAGDRHEAGRGPMSWLKSLLGLFSRAVDDEGNVDLDDLKLNLAEEAIKAVVWKQLEGFSATDRLEISIFLHELADEVEDGRGNL